MQSDIPSSSLSFWQSSIWEAILHDSGQARDIIVFSYGSEAIMIELRPLGLGMLGAFSLGVDLSLYTMPFLQQCKKHIVKQGAIFWQIEEYHSGGITLDDIPDSTYGKHFLEPWTRVVDLSLPEEDIMANMHEKGRYNIRLAWKRDVKTTWVDPTPDAIDTWMSLLDDTTNRDGFSRNSREYYISFLQNLRDNNAGGMMFATYEGQVIAAGIFVYYHGVAIYYYGASTSDIELRKHMAPYLIQWEAMREGKIRGCSTYDFLGIAPPGEIGHSLEGVTSFKEKFGGKIIEIGFKQCVVVSRLQYAIFAISRYLKRAIYRVWSKIHPSKKIV